MERVIGSYSVEGQIIEYSITGKIGEPILVMHGGHSNCNEEFGYRSLLRDGFMIITPTRAGYGNTSKDIGESLDRACYYYVELLNYQGIEQVHVLAISAGGPSGLYFTSHYADRVKTLTLQSAVTKEWHTPNDAIYKLAKFIFRPPIEKMTWNLISTMSNLSPTLMFTLMYPSFSKLSYTQIKGEVTGEDVKEIRKMNNRQRSGFGFLIDLLQTKEISSKELKAISSPTLILHSKNDGAVSSEHAYYAYRQISDSELCILESWGHLIWLSETDEYVNKKTTDFMASHSKT